jgi:type VI secretion system secreted protein Hcp
MASSMFLQINSESGGAVNGESIAAGYENQIEVTGYSIGAAQKGASSSGKGGSTGTATIQDVVITAVMDKSFPTLLQMAGNGTHIKNATLTICKTGGGLFPYHIITMTSGILSSVSAAGTTNDEGTPLHLMTISINFSQVQSSYTAQDSTGQALGGAVTGKINIAGNS